MDKTIGGVAASAHINNIIIITRKREVIFFSIRTHIAVKVWLLFLRAASKTTIHIYIYIPTSSAYTYICAYD